MWRASMPRRAVSRSTTALPQPSKSRPPASALTRCWRLKSSSMSLTAKHFSRRSARRLYGAPPRRAQLRVAARRMGGSRRSERQLYGRGVAAMSVAPCLGVGLDPRYAAEFDAFIGERPRFFGARLAIDRVRVGLAVVDAARFLGKAFADIVAIRLDLAAQFHQCGAHLRRRDRRRLVAGAADVGSHDSLLDLRIAAMRAGDLTRIL